MSRSIFIQRTLKLLRDFFESLGIAGADGQNVTAFSFLLLATIMCGYILIKHYKEGDLRAALFWAGYYIAFVIIFYVLLRNL